MLYEIGGAELELVFNEAEHKYFVDGVEYPSVSEIIKPLGDDVDEDSDLELVFESAAERGTLCTSFWHNC